MSDIEKDLLESEINAEQAHLDTANSCISEIKKLLVERLEGNSNKFISHNQNRVEHNAITENSINMLNKYDGVVDKLIFGRLDLDDGSVYHIGKIGVADSQQRKIVLDWRAPVSGKYYQSRPTDTQGVSRKRSIKINNNRVLRISDELFNSKMSSTSIPTKDSTLFENITSYRDKKMQSVVSSLQFEQDEIIRSEDKGAVIITGAPGTGKSVVALHRAAYLLYKKKDIMSRKGVLILGPNKEFTEYISDVLPSLGENQTVVATTLDLYDSDITISKEDPEYLIKIKSSKKMAEVIDRAIWGQIKIPNGSISLNFIDIAIIIKSDVIKKIVKNAKIQSDTYNEGRVIAMLALMDVIADEMLKMRGFEANDIYSKNEMLTEIRESSIARRNLNSIWMPKTPSYILSKVLSKSEDLARYSEGIFSQMEISNLSKACVYWASESWSSNDIPILDEIYSKLGEIAINTVDSYSSFESDERDFEINDSTIKNRSWRYGHVIVDEAQDITEMEWRMILRRVSNDSITVVGDQFQKINPGSCVNLENLKYQFNRYTEYNLNVNYRTPKSVLDYAEGELQRFGLKRGSEVISIRDEKQSIIMVTMDTLKRYLDSNSHLGSTAVITADGNLIEELREFEHMSPEYSRGREFDNVFIYYHDILTKKGINALYIGSTRANKKLIVIK